MSLKNDLERLKRLANPNSIQWRKVIKSIDRVMRQVVIPIFPNNPLSNTTLHKLPWGYELRYWQGLDGISYELSKWDSDTNLLLTFSGYAQMTHMFSLIDLATDISNGWLDQVRKMSEKKS